MSECNAVVDGRVRAWEKTKQGGKVIPLRHIKKEQMNMENRFTEM